MSTLSGKEKFITSVNRFLNLNYLELNGLDEDRFQFYYGNKSVTIAYEYGDGLFEKYIIKDDTMSEIYKDLQDVLEQVKCVEVVEEQEDYSHLMEQFRPILS